MNDLQTFFTMSMILGRAASDDQVSTLVDWMRANVSRADLPACESIALNPDAPASLFTAISEYMGECGA